MAGCRARAPGLIAGPPSSPPQHPLQVVLVELCRERQPILTADKIREPSLSEVVTEIRTGCATPFQGVYSWWVPLGGGR